MALVKSMSNIFPDIEVGKMVSFEGVEIFPLYTSSRSGLDYEVSSNAIETGQISVKEVGDEGTVSCLLVENAGDSQVFFMEGEQLIGGKQNRTLNTSILAAAKSNLRVPVSCVERGRWRYRNGSQHPADYSSSTHSLSRELRSSLRGSVSRSLDREAGHHSSQGQVWDEIDKEQQDLGVSSVSSDIEETYHVHSKKLVDFKENLLHPEGAVGLVVSIRGRIVSFDIFDKASTCKLLWGRLVSGYTLSSLKPGAIKRCGGNRPDDAVSDIDGFVATARAAPWKLHKAVGDGVEYRAQTKEGLEGFVLQYEDQLVHGSLLATR